MFKPGFADRLVSALSVSPETQKFQDTWKDRTIE